MHIPAHVECDLSIPEEKVLTESNRNLAISIRLGKPSVAAVPLDDATAFLKGAVPSTKSLV